MPAGSPPAAPEPTADPGSPAGPGSPAEPDETAADRAEAAAPDGDQDPPAAPAPDPAAEPAGTAGTAEPAEPAGTVRARARVPSPTPRATGRVRARAKPASPPAEPPATEPPPAEPPATEPPATEPPAGDAEAVDATETGETRDPIEATTGAPIGSLPRRAPVRQPRDGWPAPTSTGWKPAEPGAPVEGVDEPAFWLPIEEVHWDGRPVRDERETWLSRWRAARAAAHRASRPPPPPRNPVAGLAGLVLFALTSGFFGWVSAEPLWLAVGHGERGVATVSSCSGSGVGLACQGRFTARTGWTSPLVPVVGVVAAARTPGSQVAARMVDAEARKAYAEAGVADRHLRWLLGLAAALGCGPGIVWATGARRLPEPRGRRAATLAALAVPVLLLTGFLVYAF
ncbi:hypothetical protein [Plantactinospora sp. KBS50]|uniref:hypothetical protein n=1 Tax=Plantactinospora sp. KBS50 TaxID=2024580 RepID=UPI000BAA9DBF|nr:hypothetical protein [Plantactinospora sp. KBS50]ASW53466.1 hypothetical protein CIK06_03605 [Plantactinospora sp. KBS50]